MLSDCPGALPTPHGGGEEAPENAVIHQSPDEPQRPRSEPEILPPERGESRAFRRRRHAREAAARAAFETQAYEYVHVSRPGPFAIFLAVLGLGAVAAALVVFVLGTVLVALPLIGTIVAVALLAGLLRGSRRRLH
jgi:hypothetical protein